VFACIKYRSKKELLSILLWLKTEAMSDFWSEGSEKVNEEETEWDVPL